MFLKHLIFGQNINEDEEKLLVLWMRNSKAMVNKAEH